LQDAGLAVVEQLGDWDRQTVTPDGPKIITIAHAA
jgi:hypothetical protein